MDIEQLDLFCGIYKDKAILERKSVIEVMLDLQAKTNDVHGIMYNPFSGSSAGSKINDNVIYDAINNLSYDRGAGIEYIDKWLKEFKINIDDIIKNNLGSNKIKKFIRVKHNVFKGSVEEKRKAHLIQAEFLDYFLKFYADSILGNNYKHVNDWEIIRQTSQFDVAYLNDFCNSIYNIKSATKISFTLNYETNIKFLASKLENEIQENILGMSIHKKDTYLEYVTQKLTKRMNVEVHDNNLNRWMNHYNVNIGQFPNFNNKELNEILYKDYMGNHNSVNERQEVFQIQTDFYFFACMFETNKLIEFLNSKKNKTVNDVNMIKDKMGNPDSKRLTVNQSVILLDKLEVFNSECFAAIPNVKQAEILSLLLGKDKKNIKTAIESLSKKPSDLGVGYPNDLKMIQRLLDSK